MRALLTSALLAGLLGPAGAGEIFCQNGGKDCSDRPSPGATLIRTEERRPDAPRAEAPARTATAAATATNAGNAADQQPASTSTRQAFQKDLDQARAERCKKAQDAYQQSLQARRIYRTNAAGEREYLSDAEADQMRLNARIEMEQSCGSGGR